MNIAEILKDKPSGIQLYSLTFGELLYEGLMYNLDEYIITHDNELITYLFMSDGRFHKNGECTLYPSRKMRDWKKFSWKKGDVLVSNDGSKNVIFDGFMNDIYTLFKGKHSFDKYRYDGYEYAGTGYNLNTKDYSLEEEGAAKKYINVIENRLNRKLNMKTLKVEDIKPKWTPKPFDKVLVRCSKADKWSIDFFSHIDKGDYICSGDSWFKYCLPYNEETKKLIGTTNWE